MAVNQNVLDDIMATQPDEERLAILASDHKTPRLELDPVMNMVNEIVAMWENDSWIKNPRGNCSIYRQSS